MSELEGKTILVTGASGFIGTHLAARISSIPRVRLLLLSRQSTQPLGNAVWLQGDLRKLTSAYWLTQGVDHIDYVFHLGGFIPKSSTESNQSDQAIENNILGTHAFLKSLPGTVRKIVFASTIDVYAQTMHEEVLTENSPVAPESLYGASKLFCESLIYAWAKERDCDFALLRYGHIYGPGEEKFGKLIPVIIRQLFAGQPPSLFGDGSALRDYLYVGDAVEATLRAACVEGSVGPLNIVRGQSVTLKEIVQSLIRVTGSGKSIELMRDKPNGHSLQFNNGAMIRLLGEWRMTSLNEGLAAEVDAFRSRSHAR